MPAGQDNKKLPLILIVDDDPTFRTSTSDLLRGSGFDVIETEDAKQGLLAVQRFEPDLVLLDIVMPEMDGFKMCEALKKLPGGRSTAVVMMTGLDDSASINHAYKAGAIDFLTKPVNPLLLVQRIRYILQASNNYKELLRNRSCLGNAQRIVKFGHWEWLPDNNKLRWSAEARRILGIFPERFASVDEFYSKSVHPEDVEFVRQAFNAALIDYKAFSIDHRIIQPNGLIKFVHHRAQIETRKNETKPWITGIIQDITERKQSEQEISHMAHHDSLTGLPNRLSFTKYVGKAVRSHQRSGKMFALLFLDVDLFMRINDTLGHDAGDMLLEMVAERLSESIRANDLMGGAEERKNVARFGGDEFTVLATGIKSIQDIAKLAQRLLAVVSQPYRLAGEEIFITVSIGISIFPRDGEKASTLLKNADSAMNHAKLEGKNNYRFYEKSMSQSASEKLRLENDLRKALEQGQLMLFYQPIFQLSSQRVVEMEALIRWQHPDFGLLPPGKFIYMAEENGLIPDIGEWVLRTACFDNISWQRIGLPAVRVSVNMSGKQFKKPQRLIRAVNQALSESKLDPRLLTLELTESTLMEDLEKCIVVLSKLKQVGISISVDDFGTGYSSLNYLTRLPLDNIKIDRCFILKVPGDHHNETVISSIIGLAKRLNMKAIAEGVETEAQLDFLRRQECDEVQGFLLAKPFPHTEVGSFMQEHFRIERIGDNQ